MRWPEAMKRPFGTFGERSRRLCAIICSFGCRECATTWKRVRNRGCTAVWPKRRGGSCRLNARSLTRGSAFG